MSNLPDAKELAKLAAACRKAGITSFKGGGIEFTLGEAPLPASAAKKQAQAFYSSSGGEPETDELTHEQLLAWSLADPTGESRESKN